MSFLSAFTGTGRRAPVQAILAWVGVAAFLLAGAAPAAAQRVRESTVENRAYLSYRSDNGVQGGDTARVTVTVSRPVGVAVTPDHEVTMDPGERRVLAHRVQNQGAAADSFRLALAGPAGWRLSLFLDVDGDGQLGERDVAVSGALSLAGGASSALLLVLEAPADFAGAGVEVALRATSASDPSVTGAATDRVTVGRGRPAATLDKSVDLADALRGDTLSYTLTFANRGVAALADVRLQDPLPAGVRFVPGSLRLNGAPLTDAADADAGSVSRDAAGRETVAVRPGPLAPGAGGTVAFRAAVAADAAEGPLANVATLLVDGTRQVASAPAETRVGTGRLEVAKERTGDGPVRVGGELTFRLAYANRSAAAVREAVLVDSLPPELVLVSAEGAPEVEGRTVRWRLGTLQPGASGAFTVVVRVEAAAEGRSVVNRATVQGLGVVAAVAASAPVVAGPAEPGALEVRKSAAVLEAGVGESVPYTVVLRNGGAAPMGAIVLHDLLPAGTRMVEGSLRGADSLRVDGREVRIFFAGPLAPGAEHTVRYSAAVVSPGDVPSLGNRAWAEAAGGRVRSDTAVAWVRLRAGHAMQTRTLIGKVWLDEDGDGRQGPGEKGVPGAGVWSADGEVVTTDREGRFSFRDLRPGTHVLRLDTLGLPAGYTVARRGEELATVRMDGWTAPRASFRVVRLLPGGGREGAAAVAPASGPSSVDASAW